MNRPRASLLLLVALSAVAALGCSTQNAEPAQNNSAADSMATRIVATIEARRDSAQLRSAVVDCLRRKGFKGEVRGIGIVDDLGDSFCEIAAVDTNAETVTYLVINLLKDQSGTFYLRADYIDSSNLSVLSLIKGKSVPNEKEDEGEP